MRSRLRPRALRLRGVGAYRRAATGRLKAFRQASVLAVGFTGLALLLAGEPADGGSPLGLPAVAAVGGAVVQDAPFTEGEAPFQDAPPETPDAAVQETPPASLQDTVAAETSRSVDEATGTVRELARGSFRLLPKVLIALAVLLLAGLLSWAVRRVLRLALGRFGRADASAALLAVGIWVLAIAAALSIIAGDARALLGSVGLLGLALSWALQGPIESFSAWLLNSFKGYYQVGDRIAVGDVFGDVYRIDFLNTTVWEAGGPDKAVQAAQPTGALITFPNSELLRSNIVNYTRDFPFVWDEVMVGVANESDLRYARGVVREIAHAVVGPVMRDPAGRYREILGRAGLAYDVAEEPEVFLSPTDSWTNLVVRYLVPVRERRRWSTTLYQALASGMAAPEHGGRILPAYPRTVIGPPPSRGPSSDAAGEAG